MIWLLNRFRPGRAKSREFVGETGRAGLTALNIPPVIDLSATGAPLPGMGDSSESRNNKYSAKVG
jgi:hypothetical protein